MRTCHGCLLSLTLLAFGVEWNAANFRAHSAPVRPLGTCLSSLPADSLSTLAHPSVTAAVPSATAEVRGTPQFPRTKALAKTSMRQPNTGAHATPAAIVVNPPSGAQSRQPASSNASQQQGAGEPNRIQETIAAIPVATLFFLAVNIFVYILTAVEMINASDGAISAYLVIFKWQWYRMATSAFLHGGLMHIGMNMMSLYYMGISLENLFGTVQFFIFTMLFVALDGLLYVLGNTLLAYVVFRDMSW